MGPVFQAGVSPERQTSGHGFGVVVPQEPPRWLFSKSDALGDDNAYGSAPLLRLRTGVRRMRN